MTASLSARPTRLFIVLAAFFVANAVIAEFVGVKIFALEPTLGLPPFGWNLFGQTGSLSFTKISMPPSCGKFTTKSSVPFRPPCLR